jgi:hypothetical protein
MPEIHDTDQLLSRLRNLHLGDMYGWLDDLSASFPDDATDAVKGSLWKWQAWAEKGKAGPTEKELANLPLALNKQGETWRRLLSGEILAENLLTADHYKKAASRLLARIRDLTLSFLGRWWLPITILLASVGLLIWAILVYVPGSTETIVALIATAAGALGISWKTVGSTLGRAVSKVEDQWWNSEIREAIITAATFTPQDSANSRTAVTAPLPESSARSLPSTNAAPDSPAPGQPPAGAKASDESGEPSGFATTTSLHEDRRSALRPRPTLLGDATQAIGTTPARRRRTDRHRAEQ